MEQKLIEQEDNVELRLDSLTDFNWDTVFFIGPYVSKEEIEKETLITSKEIEDNFYDESIIYMIFTKNNNFVYKIIGNSESLNFDFDIGEYNKVKKLYQNDCIFTVNKHNGFTIYTLKE